MSYFVTGATGFIGRHLVERLLEREGDIHVLVREESQEKLDALRERLGRRRPRQARQPATSPSRCLGVSEEDRKALRRRRALLPPRGDLRHDRRRGAQPPAQRQRHAERRRPRQRARRRPLPPRLLDRGRGRVRGPLHRGLLRRGPEAPAPVPPDQVRGREARARSELTVPWRVYRPVDRRRQLPDRRDGQDRRARTTSSRRSRSCATRCRSGSRWSASRSAGRTSCRSTTSPRRWTTSRTSPTSTARPSTSSTRRSQRVGRGLNTFARPATRRRWSCASTSG